MARENTMADISTYVAESQIAPSPVVSPDLVEGPVEATDAPEIETSSKAARANKEELNRELQEARARSENANIHEERASVRELKAQQEESARIREKESAARQKGREALQGVQDTGVRLQERISTSAQEVGSWIGAVPIPGSILLPLSILLIFFFALLPINGHTRLMWLWLVLTGNAHLSGENLATPSQGGLSSTIPTEPFTPPAVPPTEPFNPAAYLPTSGGQAVNVPKPVGGNVSKPAGGQAVNVPKPVGGNVSKPAGGQAVNVPKTPAKPVGGSLANMPKTPGGNVVTSLQGLGNAIMPFGGVGEP